MKRMMAVVGVGLGGLLMMAAGCGRPGETSAPEGTEVAVRDAVPNQRLCPVMPNMAISRSIYVDHEGERVYFCCPGCVEAFQAEPERYLAKLRELHADPAGDAVPATEQEGHGPDDGHGH